MPGITTVVSDGIIFDPRIDIKTMGLSENMTDNKIEHYLMLHVHGIVIHQTGGDKGEGTIQQYKNSRNGIGAHFLITEKGIIIQTARVNRQAYHVGNIKSLCLDTKACVVQPGKRTSPEHDILYGKGSYGKRIGNLSEYEKKKGPALRYPSNNDSIGIEVVGAPVDGKYPEPNAAQRAALLTLILILLGKFPEINKHNIYCHSQVSYKNESEGVKALNDLRADLK